MILQKTISYPIIDNQRCYFGICSCCGCYFGIEYVNKDLVVYRCFPDKLLQVPCDHYTIEPIQLDKNGRCGFSDCKLDHCDFSNNFDEIQYLKKLIEENNKFTIAISVYSQKILELLRILQNDYSIYQHSMDNFQLLYFLKKGS